MRNPRRYRSPRNRFDAARRPAPHPRSLSPLALACTLCLAAAAPGAHAATFVWTGGTYVPGSTAPDPLGAGNVLQINSGAGKSFNGAGMTNQGTVTWNADALSGANGAVINNQALWNLRADADSFVWTAGGQPVFNNSGTFRKSLGSLNSLGNWHFVNNGGTVDAQVGTLSFNGGAPVFNDGSRFIGAGNVRIDTAANFNGGLLSDSLLLASGSFTGTAARLEAGYAGAGLLRWSGGVLAGDWEIAAGQGLAALDGSGKQLQAAPLTNNGTVAWQSTESLLGANGGQLVNNGLFDIQAPATTVWVAGGQPSLVNNASGTVHAAAGVAFTSGNFSWVSNGGLFDAEAGASINFNGGTARFNNNTRFTGAGSNLVSGNASFVDKFTSANLTLASGAFTGGDGSPGSKALLAGTVGWSGGQLAGTWQIAAKQKLNGVAGAAKLLTGSLTNLGVIDWSTVEGLQGANGATLLNKKTIDATLTNSLVWVAGGQPTLNNAAAGLVRASAGATFSLNNWNIVNNGGRFDAAAGSTMLFNGSTNTFNDGSRFTGAGSNTVTGTARFVGTITSDNLRFSAGSLIGGDGTPLSRALLNGSTEWLGGDFSGAWTLPAAQKLNANTGPNGKRLSGDFVNAGTLLWNTTDGLSGQNGAVWTNNGVFEARKSATLTWVAGGQPSLINSATGIVRANKGAVLTMGNFALTSNAGRFDAKPNSSIVFNGGSTTFNDNTQFIGTGSNSVTGNARFVGLQRSANLLLAGGTLTGGSGAAGSKAVLRGTTAWTGGELAGNWQLEAAQSLNAAGTGTRRIGGSFNNAGNIAWSSNDGLQLQNSAAVVNDGNWLLQSDADIVWVAGGQPSLVNNGLLRKSAGSGESSLNSLVLTNNGTLQVDSGSIALPPAFVNGGVLSGTGAFSGATVSNGGVISPGDFNAVVAASTSPWGGLGARLAQSGTAATLNINGNYSQLAAGGLDMQVTNAASFDKLLVTGNASLAGALNIGCLGTCSFSAGSTLVLLDATGSLTGTFSSVNFVGLPANAFNVSYDAAGGRVLLNVTAPVAAVAGGGAR